MRNSINEFETINLVDFEFGAMTGEHPVPICLVWRELRLGTLKRVWANEMGERPPYPIGPNDLFVAYYASAELGCHIALGWGMPANVLDLCAEFKNRFSGITLPAGKGLVGALLHFGLEAISLSALTTATV
jgi:DNA polymerase I